MHQCHQHHQGEPGSWWPIYNFSAGGGAAASINIIAVCGTPTATLMQNFTMSTHPRTEWLMVTTTVLMTFLGVAFLGLHRSHSPVTCIFFRACFSLFLLFMSYAFSQAKSTGNQPRSLLILLWMLLVELVRKKVYAMVAPACGAFARGVGHYSSFDAVEEAARMVWIGYLVYAYVHGFSIKSFFIILWACRRIIMAMWTCPPLT